MTDDIDHERLERVLGLFTKNWRTDYNDNEDPAFILAGDVPDYSDRLPDDYRVCVHLGTHGGADIVYYSPRAFTVDGTTLKIFEGHLGTSECGESEFSVKVDGDDIVNSVLLNPAGYHGDELHELEPNMHYAVALHHMVWIEAESPDDALEQASEQFIEALEADDPLEFSVLDREER